MTRNKLAGQVKGHGAARRDFRRVTAAQADRDVSERHRRRGIAGHDPTPSRDLAARELLEEALRRLSPEEKRILDCREQGGQWAQIAAELGSSPEAIRKRLARAVDRVATRTRIGRIALMSTSRESDRSPPASDRRRRSGCLADRIQLPLVQHHRRALARRGTAVGRGLPPGFPPTTLDDDELLDLIYNEVVLREEDGESPELDEYLERFPRYAEDLRAQFDVHRALQSGGPFTLDLSSASFDPREALARTPTGEAASASQSQRLAPTAAPPSAPARLPLAVCRPSRAGRCSRATTSRHVLGSGGMGTVFRAL